MPLYKYTIINCFEFETDLVNINFYSSKRGRGPISFNKMCYPQETLIVETQYPIEEISFSAKSITIGSFKASAETPIPTRFKVQLNYTLPNVGPVVIPD